MTNKFTPRVEAAKHYAGRFLATEVIILDLDYEDGTLKTVSYGFDPKHCAHAQKLARVASRAIDKYLAQER